MKRWLKLSLLCVPALVAAIAIEAQEGPVNQGSQTVGKRKKPADSSTPAEEEQPKIPSKFNKKNAEKLAAEKACEALAI